MCMILHKDCFYFGFFEDSWILKGLSLLADPLFLLTASFLCNTACVRAQDAAQEPENHSQKL